MQTWALVVLVVHRDDVLAMVFLWAYMYINRALECNLCNKLQIYITESLINYLLTCDDLDESNLIVDYPLIS